MGAAEFALLLGLIGLSIGSFLNVCVDRLPLGRSIVSVPFHCAACGHGLGVIDLIPLLSYMWMRGRWDLIPFGRFLASAGVASLFWGGSISTWYQGLFLP